MGGASLGRDGRVSVGRVSECGKSECGRSECGKTSNLHC